MMWTISLKWYGNRMEGEGVDASYYSAADLAAGYARQELDPVSVTEDALEAARAAQLAFNAISAIDERCLAAAEESRKRFAPRHCARSAGRRARHRQGQLPLRRSSSMARQRRCTTACLLELRFRSGATSARGRRDHHRQDHDARLRHAGVRNQLAVRRHHQSVEHVADARRVELWCRGDAGRRRDPDRDGDRHRRIGASAGRALRRRGNQADARADRLPPASMARSAGPMARSASDLETMLRGGRPVRPQ